VKDIHIRSEHHTVFQQEGHFSGWPANYGVWAWANEVLVVFADGKLGSQGALHARDRHQPFVPRQARSIDGGQNWRIEPFSGDLAGSLSLSADEHLSPDLKSGDDISPASFSPLRDPIDFMNQETILMAARTGLGEDAIGWFYASSDRGLRWSGPHGFDGLDQEGLAARTDIVPLSHDTALVMLSCAKPDGTEGQVFCAETNDSGRTFTLKSFIASDPEGYAIMPSSVGFADGTILTIVRHGKSDLEPGWLEAYASKDDGSLWRKLGIAVENTGRGGNPPSLVLMRDDSVALIYGVRERPYGLRIKISEDQGITWSHEAVVRNDGVLPDLGYPKSCLLSDGKILTAYYFNDGAERFIAASVIEVCPPVRTMHLL
jgi:hypothetical protein